VAGSNAAQFPQVFFQDAASSSLVPHHGVRHLIQTVSQPATAKFRLLDPTRLATAKKEFQSMLDEGIIRCSSSQWSSPLQMVQKKDCSWRPWGYYCQLNLQTVEDKYPLPNIANLAARLDGCKLFSKLDLARGTFKFQWRQRTSPKRPSSRHLVYLNSLACLSG
jgi:hypothetical protein